MPNRCLRPRRRSRQRRAPAAGVPAIGGVTPEAIIPLARLAGLNVRRTFKAPSLFDPRRPVKAGPGVALTFHIRPAEGSDAIKTREMHFGVRDLDRVEEVADLAQIVVAAVLGVFGLIFGGIAMVAVASALPRTVLLDWTTRSILFRTLTKRREISFGDIQAVELRPLQHLSTGKSPRHYYWCEVGLRLRAAATGDLTWEPLVATERVG